MTMNFLKGLHRRALGLSKDNEVMARSGFVAGGEDKPAIAFPSPDTVAILEDFIGLSDTGVATRYNDIWIVGFSDTGQILPQQGPVGVSTAFVNGVFRMTSSATSVQDPVSGCQSLNTPAIWKANQGQYPNRPLRYGVRLKTNTLAGNTVFAGFTDTGGTEMPAYDTGAGILTPAADYAGFIWSGEGGATQQAYRLVAGKAGVDQSATTGITPTAGVYDVLELEVAADGGSVIGYINGKAVAQIPSAAITATVALGAGIWRANTDAAANAIDYDWVAISAPRDTGT